MNNEENNRKDLEELTEDSAKLVPVEDSKEALTKADAELVDNIIKADNMDELKNLSKLFGVNQAKKNIIRVVSLNELLDMVYDQATERITKRPQEISTKELLDYMQVIQNQIDKSQKTIDRIEDVPMIQLTQQHNSINVNIDNKDLDRESRERVIDVVSTILKGAMANVPKEEPIDIIDIEEINEEGEE